MSPSVVVKPVESCENHAPEVAGLDVPVNRQRRNEFRPAYVFVISAVVGPLKAHRTRQLAERLAAGPLWHDRGLVFTSQTGEPLDSPNVCRAFRSITRRAGLGTNWTPRELRHSFVSIMSNNGVPIETIADLVGHASTSVTETVYRHQLKPVITKGAETMNTIFTDHADKKTA